MATITVIEPHALLRLGLVQLLSDVIPDLSLQSSESPKPSATAATWPVDLVLLSLYSLDDAAALVSATEQAYSPKAIILMAEQKIMPRSLAGLSQVITGYIPKSSPPEVLQAAVRLVLAGGTCFPQDTSALAGVPSGPRNATTKPGVNAQPTAAAPQTQPLTTTYSPPRWPPSSQKDPQPARVEPKEHEMLGLTPRQYEVLVLLARGYPMKMVGRCLNISVAAAKAHTETLYQRLDVHNRNAAVYAAVSRGAKLGWTCIGGQSGDGEAKSGRP